MLGKSFSLKRVLAGVILVWLLVAKYFWCGVVPGCFHPLDINFFTLHNSLIAQCHWFDNGPSTRDDGDVSWGQCSGQCSQPFQVHFSVKKK